MKLKKIFILVLLLCTLVSTVFIGTLSVRSAYYASQNARYDTSTGSTYNSLREAENSLKNNPRDIKAFRTMVIFIENSENERQLWVQKGLSVYPNDRFLLFHNALILKSKGYNSKAIMILKNLSSGNDEIAHDAGVYLKGKWHNQ